MQPRVIGLSELASVWHDDSTTPPSHHRLLTLQNAEVVLGRLGLGEPIVSSWDRVDESDLPAYLWLAQRMAEQGIAVDTAPIWAWKRLDLVQMSAHWAAGDLEAAVAVVAEVPKDRTVLTDFESWTQVLNGGFVASTDRDDPAFARRVLLGTGLMIEEAREVSDELASEVERSWSRTFELADTSRQAIQAVTSHIDADEIVDVYRLRVT